MFSGAGCFPCDRYRIGREVEYAITHEITPGRNFSTPCLETGIVTMLFGNEKKFTGNGSNLKPG